MIGHRQALIRRSARNGTVLGPTDNKSESDDIYVIYQVINVVLL